MESPSERQVGSDRVVEREDRLIIESPSEMDGWEVRVYRRLLVRYAGRDWTPRRIERAARGAVRYELSPFTRSPLEIPGDEVEYGLDYVERRDREAARRRREAHVSLVLGLLSPLVGLLGARLKGRIEDRFGINASTATARSVAIEALAIGPALAVVVIGVVAGGLAGESVGLPWRTCAAIALVLAPDVLLRWDRLLAEEHPPPGFYEWVWRRRPPASAARTERSPR